MIKPTPITSVPEKWKPSAKARLKSMIKKSPSGCWEWTGALDRYGYGKSRITLDGVRRHTGSHRISWLIFRGDITDQELQLDHLCRNRRCVNPDHLELVTSYENYLRSVPFIDSGDDRSRRRGRPKKVRTHCAHGHPWTSDNIYVRVTKEGYVSETCKEC